MNQLITESTLIGTGKLPHTHKNKKQHIWTHISPDNGAIKMTVRSLLTLFAQFIHSCCFSNLVKVWSSSLPLCMCVRVTDGLFRLSVALRSALCADCWHTDGPLHGSSAIKRESRPPYSGERERERKRGGGRWEWGWAGMRAV